LRDVLERRGFVVKVTESRPLAELREAEFVSASGTFPAGFRWEAFLGCFSRRGDRVSLYSIGDLGNQTNFVGAVDPHCALSISIRSMSGQLVEDLQQENIDVLWLSPLIFISSFDFFVGGTVRSLGDYSVTCDERSNSSRRQLWTFVISTSLSTLEGDEHGEPSPLLLEFFQHVTSQLPVGYFAEIDLKRHHRQRCPVGYITLFLSIIQTLGTQTEISGNGTITRDELRHILSYQFHPAMKLEFDSYSFDKSVSLTILNDLLKDARYLRAIEMPMELVGIESWRDCCPPCHEEIALKSPDLYIHLSEGRISPKCLHAISTKHNPYEVTLDMSDCCEEALLEFVHPFMAHDTSIENLLLRSHYNKHRNEDDELITVEEYSCSVADAMPVCQSNNLCIFNVSIAHMTETGLETKQCNRVPWWDYDIFPLLALNFHRKRLTNPTGAVVPVAIRAVNQGIVYSKTTDHIPFNPRIANAGLLFRMVKHQAQSQSVDVPRWTARDAPSM
jgi:hypothetical protein